MARNSKAIPCAIGQGEAQPCDYCDESRALEVTSWNNTTMVKNFTMPNAPSELGGGYDVYWNIEQPGDGCRILLFEPFATDKGSVNQKIPGTIILSVNHGGCYAAHIGSRGLAAGACCWDDCINIGAVPAPSEEEKRNLPPPHSLSRVMRSIPITEETPRVSNPEARKDKELRGEKVHSDTQQQTARRGSGGQSPNPFYEPPEENKPTWNCKAEKIGSGYSKTGIQQVGGKSIPCRSTGCDFSFHVSVSTGTTVSSERSTSFTNSEGFSVSVNAGVMFIGPTATTTVGYNSDFSKSVAESMGTSESETSTFTTMLSQSVAPGATYNAWWAPYLRCQKYAFSCNDGTEKADMEKCEPWLDASGETVGAQSVMTTGSA